LSHLPCAESATLGSDKRDVVGFDEPSAADSNVDYVDAVETVYTLCDGEVESGTARELAVDGGGRTREKERKGEERR